LLLLLLLLLQTAAAALGKVAEEWEEKTVEQAEWREKDQREHGKGGPNVAECG